MRTTEAGCKQVYPYASLSPLDVICRGVFLSLEGRIMHDIDCDDRVGFEYFGHECGIDLRIEIRTIELSGCM